MNRNESGIRGVGTEPLNSGPGAEEGSLHQYKDLTLLTLRECT
jgi:hypothetical protein